MWQPIALFFSSGKGIHFRCLDWGLSVKDPANGRAVSNGNFVAGRKLIFRLENGWFRRSFLLLFVRLHHDFWYSSRHSFLGYQYDRGKHGETTPRCKLILFGFQVLLFDSKTPIHEFWLCPNNDNISHSFSPHGRTSCIINNSMIERKPGKFRTKNIWPSWKSIWQFRGV